MTVKPIKPLLLYSAAVSVCLCITGCAASDTGNGTRSLAPNAGVASTANEWVADMTVSAAENDEMDTIMSGQLGYSQALGSFSTVFNPKNTSRSCNIALASDAINQHVVNPGETFSYNETVGPTSKKNGYKLGTIFIKGKMYEGYGGGVCQVSSTLYNAAANAGMTIVERHDHSMPVPYVETGQDAATSYGGIDFKFTNNKPFPVIINSHVDNGTISVSITPYKIRPVVPVSQIY